MSDHLNETSPADSDPSASAPPPIWGSDPARPFEPAPAGRSRALTILSWAVIVIVAGIQVVTVNTMKQVEGSGGEDPVGELLLQVQGRYMVGVSRLSGGSGSLVYGQIQSLNTGSVGQRQRFIILAAELAGPAEARRQLDQLNRLIEQEVRKTAPGEAGDDAEAVSEDEKAQSPFELTGEQQRVLQILSKLYPPVTDEEIEGAEPAEIAVEALDRADREFLADELRWFGKLALAPAGTDDAGAREAVLTAAQRTFLTLLLSLISAAVVGLGGLIGLIVTIVFALVGRLRSGVKTGRAHHGVYAETFALWLIVFFPLQLVAGAVTQNAPRLQLLASIIAFVLSLVVVGWPVLRGIPWRQVRADIGWTAGRQPPVEPLAGLACYAMALPLLAAGLLITLVLLLIDQALAGPQPVFAPTGGPAHPIVFELADGNWWSILQILLLGSVAAPLVEETMFRGVLYRHLRDASRGLGLALSVIISSAVTAFIFAAIHPQGWMAIPALMALATAFALAREWRGTLIVPMLMHAVSNGLVLGMLSLLLAS